MAKKRGRGLGATGVTVRDLVRKRASDRRYMAALTSAELRSGLCFNRQQYANAFTPFGKEVARAVLQDFRAEARRRGRKANWIKLAEKCRAT